MNALDRPIRTEQDLDDAWHVIDGGHGYSAPQLFALIIGADGFALPTVIQVYDEDESESGPDESLIASLVESLRIAVDEFSPAGSVAIMKARPGPAARTELDRRWISTLHRHLSAAPMATHPLYYATDTRLAVVPPDELVRPAP